MATSRALSGRVLGVQLNATTADVVASLRARGLVGEQVDMIAAAAIAYATEETTKLQQRLIPETSWPGTVVCRRVNHQYVPTWLLLKRIDEGWLLDAALFD